MGADEQKDEAGLQLSFRRAQTIIARFFPQKMHDRLWKGSAECLEWVFPRN